MADKKELQFEEELVKICEIFTEGDFKNEPLDGDQVEELTQILNAQLQLLNGNITRDEYEKMLDSI